MRFAKLNHYVSGVAVPVSALRSAASCGVGEFADLPALGEWCRRTGLEVIQVLPVNDTGSNSSPYSALSAFALHPLYLRLQDLPGAGQHVQELQGFRARAAEQEALSGGRFSYRETLEFKLQFAQRVFDENEKDIRGDAGFKRWRADNPWVLPYAAFLSLRAERGGAPWMQWGALADPAAPDVAECWKTLERPCLFAAWLQMHLERQLFAASASLESMGVFLKGDLPILMSQESADVWASRRYFDLSGRAGAPPDMFSPSGQNWGFPVYDWEHLAVDGYAWWKERLRRAARFFHALRIDHVLGFFRIWRIPHGEVSGLLGRFSPSAGLSLQDLESLGYDNGRMRWMSLPHVSLPELTDALGADAKRVADTYLDRIGTENLYNIKPAADSESAITALLESPEVKNYLLSRHADRALLDDGTGIFYTPWYLESKKAFRSLSDQERARLGDLLGKKRRESEDIWEKRGHSLLSMLKDTTDSLLCAEDLGDVPDCVPRVLADLGILGLRILRWSREYKKTPPGAPAPFIPPSRYPLLSVCTPSVHDTSTLRGWWQEDAKERELFFSSLGLPGPCPTEMSPELQETIIRHCMGTGSILAMFQLQDLMDLDKGLRAADPARDRINVPGTIRDENWTWRMPPDLEELCNRENLSSVIASLVAQRRARPLEGAGQ